jgi:hypothetical protein
VSIDNHQYIFSKLCFLGYHLRGYEGASMKRRNFRSLGFAIWLSVHGYHRHRDLSFFRKGEFEGESFRLCLVYDELLTQLGRSLSKLAFNIGREDWEPEQDAERLLRLVNNWQEGVRKRAQKRTKARIAESKIAA